MDPNTNEQPNEVQPGAPLDRELEQPPTVEASIHHESEEEDISSHSNVQTDKKEVENERLALDFLDKIKQIYIDQPDIYEQFLDIIKQFKDKRVDTNFVITRVNTLFVEHPELVSDFSKFLPPSLKAKMEKQLKKYNRKLKKEQNEKPETDADQARAFVKKIKQRFADQQHIYRSFLEDLHKFSDGEQSLSDIYRRMRTLFEGHPDILEELKNFLPESTVNEYPAPQIQEMKYQRPKSKRTKYEEQNSEEDEDEEYDNDVHYEEVFKRENGSYGTYDELQYFFKIKQMLPTVEYQIFLKYLKLYDDEAITNFDLYYLIRGVLADTDPVILSWFKKFIGVEGRVNDEPLGYLADFDWSKETQLGPSYRSTPIKWRQWKCSGRIDNKICLEVLNDSWISVPTGSEDGTFKNSRKNQYEEILFKCEDDRYELDMIVEQNLSSIMFLEGVLLELNEMNYDERFHHKITVPVISKVALNRVYDEKYKEMIGLIESKHIPSILMIINRLKQKNIEWTTSRKEWSKLWNRIIEENYLKSLDYQSILFKKEEKKNLQQKVLIADLKSSKEKGLSEDMEEEESSSKNNNNNSDPILIYEIKSHSILQDIRALLVLTFDIVLRKGHTDKFEEFFDSFILKFLMADDQENAQPYDEMPQKMDEETNQRSLFIGNASYYVMFRYIIILYNRLSEGWKSSASNPPKKYANEMFFKEDQEDMVVEGEEDYQTKRYRQFLYHVELLLSNSIEQSEFEDKCRRIFGLSSYVLFTIDRIVILLAKQIQLIMSEESSKQLQKLFKLSKKHDFTEYLYINHCKDILTNEKFPCIFTYDKGYQCLGIIDIESSHINSEVNNDQSIYFKSLASENEAFYLKYSNPPLFMKRTLKKSKEGIDADVYNRLEYKSIPNSQKFGYVGEDYFYKKK